MNCVSQTLRQVNMQFVIEREDYKTAVKALNMALCVNSGTLCLASDPQRFDRLKPALRGLFVSARGVWVGSGVAACHFIFLSKTDN